MESENTNYSALLDNRNMEEKLRDCDNKIKELVKELGAKSHKFDINYTILLGVPVPKVFSIVIEYENGRTYGQSDNSFPDCFDKLVRFISMYEKVNNLTIPHIKTIQNIEGLYPIDSKYKETNIIGKFLMVQAMEIAGFNWRDLPINVLKEYENLCINEEKDGEMAEKLKSKGLLK